MDQARRGEKALEDKDYPTAIKEYTTAILQNPKAVTYYLKRSSAYRRSKPPQYDEALRDAEIAVKLAIGRQNRDLTADAQMERAMVLYSLEKYGDAQYLLAVVRKKKEKAKALETWEKLTTKKIEALPEGSEKAQVTISEDPDVHVPTEKELKQGEQAAKSESAENKQDPDQSGKVQDTANGAAQVAAPKPQGKIRYDWYQSSDFVTINFLAKGVDKNTATIDMQERSVSVSFPQSDGSTYDFTLDPLYAEVETSASSYNVTPTKIELKLSKKFRSKWSDLEGSATAPQLSDRSSLTGPQTSLPQKEAAPAYPTSSRSGPKNWDKIASDLTTIKHKDKDEEEAAADEEWTEADEDGGMDGANAFFQKLYAGASDETKRAMMKSYVESNGTALSTNWEDVGKRTIPTEPPDGMEAKKFET